MIEKLQSRFVGRLLRDEPLAKYTAARMGGPADWVYVARESLDELIEVVTTAWAEDLPVHILGGGANVLVSDKGIRGLVVINHVQEMTFGHWHHGRNVSATSGTSLKVLAQKCKSKGIGGLEWAVSVPGTVGGAVVNNAGAHGGDMAQVIADAVVLEPTGPTLMTNEALHYAYRYSSLKARMDRRFLVLLATFILPEADPKTIEARMTKFIAQRKSTQPPGASLGSIFKNPPGDYAGRLIEHCGLKGYRVGGAQVSPIHANFFINMGDASPRDYLSLIGHVQETVYSQTGVWLELEIETIGDWA